eukprot:15367157-Ditylum_brightwellii.AAC.1
MVGPIPFLKRIDEGLTGTHSNDTKNGTEGAPVELMSTSEYKSFVASLLSLESIVSPRRDHLLRGDSNNNAIDAKQIDPFEHLHPIVSVHYLRSAAAASDTSSILSKKACNDNAPDSSDALQRSVFFTVKPPACNDKACQLTYAQDRSKTVGTIDLSCQDDTKNISPIEENFEKGGSVNVNEQNNLATKKRNDQAEDDICNIDTGFEEPDTNSRLIIRVHEVDGESEVDTVVAKLISECPSESSPVTIEDASALRRSTRKRKTRLAGGTDKVVHEIKMLAKENLANLRLRLNQEYGKSAVNQKLVLLSVASGGSCAFTKRYANSEAENLEQGTNASPSSEEPIPRTTELPFDWNKRQMSDILNELEKTEGNGMTDGENNIAESAVTMIL